MRAGCSAPARNRTPGTSTCTPGSAEGTSPITDTSVSHNTLSTVPATSATRRPGMYFARRRGQNTAAASATSASASALGFRLASPSGNARRTVAGPPLTGGNPRNGRACMSMMISPTPDMNPEITAYGV